MNKTSTLSVFFSQKNLNIIDKIPNPSEYKEMYTWIVKLDNSIQHFFFSDRYATITIR